jgi:TolB-like protein/Tfp pilus assembly protein PilF
MNREDFNFGAFQLDVARGTLRRNGDPIAISSRAIALLQALLEANGGVVTKSQLMDAGWPNATVEESNLTVQIAALRKCLTTSSGGEDWITTVPRVGYRLVRSETATVPPKADLFPTTTRTGKPSIAVLPFANMSSDPEQDYFAAGIAEDLITDLSKVQGLFVIARNSSFAYSSKPGDVRTIARELGVRYVVEGSVRRAANRVRINAELIDASNNSHLWADRFDRDLADIFALQDEVVGRIVNALADVLPSTRANTLRQRPANIEAYDFFVRGRVLAMHSPEGTRKARPLLQQAIALDANFAEAHAWNAMAHHIGWKYWGEDVEPNRALSRVSAERAVSLDPGSADAHWILGYVRTYDFMLDEGIAEFEAALDINPNHADAWAFFTDLRVFEGHPLKAIESARTAFRLNPYPPGVYYWMMGWALYAAGEYEESAEILRHDAARGTGSWRLLAASLAQLGRMEEAKAEAAQFLAIHPSFSISRWGKTQPFRKSADLAHFLEGYRKAGLPT